MQNVIQSNGSKELALILCNSHVVLAGLVETLFMVAVINAYLKAIKDERQTNGERGRKRESL